MYLLILSLEWILPNKINLECFLARIEVVLKNGIKEKKKCLFKIGNEQNLGEAGGDEKEIVSLLNHALVINLFK